MLCGVDSTRARGSPGFTDLVSSFTDTDLANSGPYHHSHSLRHNDAMIYPFPLKNGSGGVGWRSGPKIAPILLRSIQARKRRDAGGCACVVQSVYYMGRRGLNDTTFATLPQHSIFACSWRELLQQTGASAFAFSSSDLRGIANVDFVGFVHLQTVLYFTFLRGRPAGLG